MLMRRMLGVFGMFVIVTLLAAADAYILTRAESLQKLAEGELRKIAGDALQWDRLSATIDNVLALQGQVTLENVRGFPLARRLPPVQARVARIHLRSGFPERFVLEDISGVISDDLFDELGGRETGKSIRDIFPDPSKLPQIVVKGGTFETRLSAVSEGGLPQTVQVGEISLMPIGGYRYHLEAEFVHPLFGRWTERGEVDLDTGAQRLSIEALGLLLTPAMRAPLIERFRNIYDIYQPGGLCDIRILIEKEAKQEPVFQVRLIARDMTFRYKNFSYPLDKVRGEIEFHTDGFVIKNMSARRGETAVRFDGTADGYTMAAAFNFRVEIDDMLLDDTLRNALDPGSRAVYDSFSPKGRISARGRATKPRGEGIRERIPLDIELHGVELLYREFPYPQKNVSGHLYVDGNRIEVRQVMIRDGTMEAEVRGVIGDISGDADVDISIDATRLPLDARLREAAGPEAQKIWEMFDPSGELDLKWHLRKQPGRDLVHEAKARCRGNTATYKDVPLPVSNLQGEVEMQPGKWLLKHLSGKVKGADVDIHGTVTEALASLHVDATGLPLDQEVKNALPGGVKDLLDVLKLGGTVSFNSGLSFKKDGPRQVDLVCKLLKGVIDTEPRFEDLDGTVTLTGYFEKEPEMIGFMDFTRATIAGKRISDVGASFNLKGTKLNFLNLKATAYGGLLAGRSMSFDTKSKDFFGELFTLDRVDLQDFVRDTKAYSDKAMSGKASLEIRNLKGNSQDAASITGKGRLVIRDALLWDIPVFLKLFTLNPGELFKSRNQFDAGVIDFDLKQKAFLIERMAFTSESVSVVGRGKIGFDGSLNMILKPRSGPLLGLDFFVLRWAGDLVSFLLDSVVSVEVRGTFDKPEIK